MSRNDFLAEHHELTRRYFLRAGLAGAAAASALWTPSASALGADTPPAKAKPKTPKAGAAPEPYFTAQDEFGDVSRGTPVPHKIPEARRKEVGLTRETWSLEVIADPQNPARLGKPLTRAGGNALNFDALMRLAETHAVRFAKVMTCLNMGCPLGMGLWEGVPLREVVWLTRPRENLRRVFYYGYHNDDPKQMFRSSLPAGRVLEDPYDLPPVLLCYKLNGEFLTPERGGPVRLVVPEAYGFKSIKWLTHVVLTNLYHANDTYGEQNNDVDSPMKTFAATLKTPAEVKAGEPLAVSGYAQVGLSGLSKVQVSVVPDSAPIADDDPYFERLPWVDAEILPPPQKWSGLPQGVIPHDTHGFDADGRPKVWPMRLSNAHWAAVLPGLPAGDYTLRSRTIDEKGRAQPMPRPFRKSGHAAIESVPVRVGA